MQILEGVQPLGRLRILHVLRAAAGGMRQHVLLLAELRDRWAFDVHVAGPLDPEAISRLEAARAGCTSMALGGRFSPAADGWAFATVARLVRDRGFDVVHAHGWKAAAVAVPAGLFGGARGCIATVHNPLPAALGGDGARSLVFRAVAGATLAMCAGVIAVCGAIREELVRMPWLQGARVVTIHNGVPERNPPPDPDGLLAAAGLLGYRPLVVAAGRLVREKGLDTLIHAVPAVAREFPRVAVAIAGDGPEAGKLRRLALDCGVADRTVFVGFRHDARDLMTVADVIVLPSRSDGLPLTLLEAMLSGKPVVATQVGGIPEAVVDGVTGMLVRPEDPLALARAIAAVCRDRDLARSLGERARMRAMKLFGAPRMVAATEKVYVTVASGRRGLPVGPTGWRRPD